MRQFATSRADHRSRHHPTAAMTATSARLKSAIAAATGHALTETASASPFQATASAGPLQHATTGRTTSRRATSATPPQQRDSHRRRANA